MSKQTLSTLSLRMQALCVFREILDTPLVRAFHDFMKTTERVDAYSRFVSEIYRAGGSLTAYVKRAVLESENVYVTSVAKGAAINPHVEASVRRELQTLSDFAALTPADFAELLGEVEVGSFSSEAIDLCKEYESVVAEIHKYGYGVFASAVMFRLSDDVTPKIEPLVSADPVSMDSFIGYHEERARVLANTEAFVEGRPAANVLLYGDAGTGKSSTVKAIANHLYPRGVRLIELRKNQMEKLPYVMEKISGNPLKFIIFIDDLSFPQGDDSFSMLKAALEGSASAKAKNAVIYATSNRRHIVQESFRDREGSDIHKNDTEQELLSLSARFGLTVQFGKPDKKLYLQIIRELAQKNGIEMDTARLEIEAEAFALRRGYRSARCAEQFINSLL